MWHKLASNPIVIDSLYGSEDFPSLENVKIRQITWKDIPNMVQLTFEPINFPNKIPNRWIGRKYNCLTIDLDIYDIYNFQINFKDERIESELRIELIGSKIFLGLKSEQNVIHIEGGRMFIQKVSGYIKE